MIGCHEQPSWLVEVAAQLCDSGESGIDLIVELYKELLTRDRAFLVPVIGSLGELPLPASLKGQVLGMMQESLSIVEEGDVPTVVRALLASISPNTRVSIVRTLRRHASRCECVSPFPLSHSFPRTPLTIPRGEQPAVGLPTTRSRARGVCTSRRRCRRLGLSPGCAL